MPGRIPSIGVVATLSATRDAYVTPNVYPNAALPARALALSAGAADAEVVLQRLLREPRCPEGFADAFRAAVRLFTAGD